MQVKREGVKGKDVARKTLAWSKSRVSKEQKQGQQGAKAGIAKSKSRGSKGAYKLLNAHASVRPLGEFLGFYIRNIRNLFVSPEMSWVWKVWVRNECHECCGMQETILCLGSVGQLPEKDALPGDLGHNLAKRNIRDLVCGVVPL